MDNLETVVFDFSSLIPSIDFFNPKRRMKVNQDRKLIRANIVFDKIKKAIDNIDKELPVILNEKPDLQNKKEKIRFAKKYISNEFYRLKLDSCERCIELFVKEFDDRTLNTSVLMSFKSRIKLVFIKEVGGMVDVLRHSLHVKKMELIKSGKLNEED